MHFAASSYHKVIYWQQNNMTEYYLVTTDHLVQYLGEGGREGGGGGGDQLYVPRNGTQGVQLNMLRADLPRFEENSVWGIKSSWKIKR